jgi:hypothetical protein
MTRNPWYLACAVAGAIVVLQPSCSGHGSVASASCSVNEEGIPPLQEAHRSRFPRHGRGDSEPAAARPGLPLIASAKPLPRPLAEDFDRFAAAADKGDMHSACLLASGLDRCRRHAIANVNIADRIDQAARLSAGSGEEVELVDYIRSLDAEARLDESLCAGLSSGQLAEWAKRTYQAATLGDTAAMKRFALHVMPARRLQVEDPPYYRLYSAHAMGMLARSAAGGDLDALRALRHAYHTGYLPNGVPYDGGRTDPTAAAAIEDAISESSPAERIATSESAEDPIRPSSLVLSDRYRRLKRTYIRQIRAYSDRQSQSRGGSKKNDDVKGCRV